jgi:methyl coenzyme M reductase subunit C
MAHEPIGCWSAVGMGESRSIAVLRAFTERARDEHVLAAAMDPGRCYSSWAMRYLAQQLRRAASRCHRLYP